jgi:hypothetical protein
LFVGHETIRLPFMSSHNRRFVRFD